MATYVPLQSIVLTSNTASVTFSEIDQSYQDLVLIMNIQGTNASQEIHWQCNGDTGSNYSDTGIYGDGSAAYSNRNSNVTSANIGNTSASNFSYFSLQLFNYSNTTTYKAGLGEAKDPNSFNPQIRAGLWRSTAAVNSITLLWTAGSFVAGSTLDLYGISPVAAKNTQASGGTGIYYDSSYVYHVFTGSGTFTPNQNLTADILTVAGGGSGGTSYAGGGGGAGGVVTSSSQSLTSATSYAVLVGAGGASSASFGAGTNGANSQFGALTAAVGGGYGNNPGQNGGSGGGGSYFLNTNNGLGQPGGSSTQTGGYGNSGGAGYATSNKHAGGGGGGAGAAGAAGYVDSVGHAGVGGNGISGNSSDSVYVSFIDAMGSATGFGELSSGHYYFGGGGGGGSYASSVPGTGGLGGGGTGGGNSGYPNQTPGKTNTGGGGGAGGDALNTGANGGSGIVIVRYAR